MIITRFFPDEHLLLLGVLVASTAKKRKNADLKDLADFRGLLYLGQRVRLTMGSLMGFDKESGSFASGMVTDRLILIFPAIGAGENYWC
jgi:hypothetical protein